MRFAILAAFITLTFAPAARADVAEIWKSKCAMCHGEDGKAETKQGKKLKIHDMSAAEFQTKHTDDQLKKAITEGVPKTKMKAFKDKYSAEEIDGLVKQVRSLAK